MAQFTSEAAANGIQVIIGAAGGAAHLPGMAAAHTSLPVIGVPVKGSSTDGMDGLLSSVRMPRGVPVAAVAINNSLKAALLAARILGVTDDRIRRLVEDYASNAEAKTEFLSSVHSRPRSSSQQIDNIVSLLGPWLSIMLDGVQTSPLS